LGHLELLVAPAVGGPLADGLIEIAYGQGKPGQARLFKLSELHLAVELAARMNRAGRRASGRARRTSTVRFGPGWTTHLIGKRPSRLRPLAHRM
jgi:hypothetical protein